MSEVINKEKELTLSQKKLKELLHYNPETGVFIRLVSKSNSVKVGDVAGSLNSQGYWWIGLNGKMFRAHRLAWLYIYGEFPEKFIDHINGIRSDNRIANLRSCTSSENNCNIGKRKSNTSGEVGVTWHKETGKWRVRAQYNGKDYSLGLFLTIPEAVKARKEFVEQHHGEFAHPTP